MRLNHCVICWAACGVLTLHGVAFAASIPIVNGDFETYDVPGVLNPATGGNWASEPGADGIVGDLDTNDEFWTSTAANARWGIGWSTSVDTGGTGLNHPNWGQFRHDEVAAAKTLNNLFSGYFIGHINVADAQGGASKYAQTAVVGQLEEGRYRAQVAVGFTRNQARPDVEYRLALVAAPDTVHAGFGTLGGTSLGDASTVMLRSAGASFDTNERWLSLVLDIGPDHPLLGSDMALRITATNLGTDNGVAQADGGAFTTASFSQATFDNVTLNLVPEPASLALIGLATICLLKFRHRRGA